VLQARKLLILCSTGSSKQSTFKICGPQISKPDPRIFQKCLREGSEQQWQPIATERREGAGCAPDAGPWRQSCCRRAQADKRWPFRQDTHRRGLPRNATTDWIKARQESLQAEVKKSRSHLGSAAKQSGHKSSRSFVTMHKIKRERRARSSRALPFPLLGGAGGPDGGRPTGRVLAYILKPAKHKKGYSPNRKIA
jgi:hypothetical protein